MDLHTHSYEICKHFLEGKKLLKMFKLKKKKENAQKVLIVAYFKGDVEKAKYASFKN